MDFGKRVAAVWSLVKPIAHGEGADRMRQHLNHKRKQVQAMTDYDKLRELAENVDDPDNWCQALDLMAHGIDNGPDAEYIAAATPNLILNLLEDLRITRAERDAEKHKHLVTEQELHLHKTQMREARAIAWDTGAQAGLDWDKNYPGNIRDSNPFKENK